MNALHSSIVSDVNGGRRLHVSGLGGMMKFDNTSKSTRFQKIDVDQNKNKKIDLFFQNSIHI